MGPGGAPAPAAAPVAAPVIAAAGFSAAPGGFSAAPMGFTGMEVFLHWCPCSRQVPMLGPPLFPLAGAVPGMPNMPMGMPGMQMAQPPSQQATRHARRVYVGGLPPTATEPSISTFFSSALAAIGGNSAGPGKWALAVLVGYLCTVP